MTISIITTTYNAKIYLEQTIKSVLNQKGDFLIQYIITDGGSTDGTIDIIKKYSKDIKWISERDKGQADGINKGLKMATGDIIAYLNADDIYTPNTLQKVAEFFKEKPEYKWLTGYCKIINEENKEIRKIITLYKNLKLRLYSYNSLLSEDFISQPATFFRSEIIKEFGYLNTDLNFVLDYEYWCRIGKKYKPGIIHDYLASFRFYKTSKTGGSYKTALKEDYEMIKNYTKNPIILGNKFFLNTSRSLVYSMYDKISEWIK